MRRLLALLCLLPSLAFGQAYWNAGSGGGGGGTPGGTNGQVQYNNAGSFGGLDSTGTGNVVRATSPTITTPSIVGNLAGDGTGGISGFNNLTPAGTLTDGKFCTYTSSTTSIGCTITAASANTASALVQRDGSGNFSGGTYTGAVTGTASGNSTTLFSGTATLGTSAISSNACATTVTVAATGGATTDVVTAGFNADPTALTGYGKSATGALLTIYTWVTSGQINVAVCNSTGNSITPSAATLNVRILR